MHAGEFGVITSGSGTTRNYNDGVMSGGTDSPIAQAWVESVTLAV